MSMSLVKVQETNIHKDIFKEGNLVIGSSGVVYLVTVVAQGYEDSSPDTFWAINLENGLSGGNFCKSLFKQFVGTVTLEGKF